MVKSFKQFVHKPNIHLKDHPEVVDFMHKHQDKFTHYLDGVAGGVQPIKKETFHNLSYVGRKREFNKFKTYVKHMGNNAPTKESVTPTSVFGSTQGLLKPGHYGHFLARHAHDKEHGHALFQVSGPN